MRLFLNFLLNNQICLDFDHIDIPLLPNTVKKMRVTLGKNTTKEDKERVMEILKVSNLSNKIFKRVYDSRM